MSSVAPGLDGGEVKSAMQGVLMETSENVFHPFLHGGGGGDGHGHIESEHEHTFNPLKGILESDGAGASKDFMEKGANFVVKNAVLPAVAHHFAHHAAEAATHAAHTFINAGVVHACPPEALNLLHHLSGFV